MSILEHTQGTVKKEVEDLRRGYQTREVTEVEFLEAETFLMAWQSYFNSNLTIAVDEGDVEEWIYQRLTEHLPCDFAECIDAYKISQDPRFFKKILWGKNVMHIPRLYGKELELVRWLKEGLGKR